MPKVKIDSKATFKKLDEIIEYLEDGEHIDIDQALEKVKQGVGLIDELDKHLKTVKNEFEEVKKKLD